MMKVLLLVLHCQKFVTFFKNTNPPTRIEFQSTGKERKKMTQTIPSK